MKKKSLDGLNSRCDYKEERFMMKGQERSTTIIQTEYRRKTRKDWKKIMKNLGICGTRAS